MKGGNRVAGDDQFPLDGQPIPSKGWDSEHLQQWNDLLSLIPSDMLRRIDRYLLWSLVDLIVRERKMAEALRADPMDQKLARTHLVTVQQVIRLSGHFGLSPIDRQRLRLSFKPVEEEDLVGEFLERLSKG